MALAARVLAHGRELVDLPGALLVVRPGLQRQAGRGDRAAVVLLLLVVERGVDRVDRRGGAGDLRGGHVRRDRHQPAVAHAVDADLGGQVQPLGRVVAAVSEVGAGVPVAAGEHRVGALFLGEFHAGLHGEEVDALVERIAEVLGVLLVPVDALLRQQVVPAERAQADRAVLLVGDRGLRHRQLVEIDHVVEHAHLDRDQALEHVGDQVALALLRHHGAAQVHRRQVADDEVAGLLGGDDLIAGDDLLHHLRRAHVLQDLGAEVRRVHAADVLVRVLPVHLVAVEHEGIPGLELRDHDPLEDVDRLDRLAADALVGDHLLVALAEAAVGVALLLVEEILQVEALHAMDLVRVEQVPVAATLDRFHEEIGDADRGEHVVRAQALVTVVEPQVEEVLDVAVPHVEIHRDRALALAQLVHRHGGVVELLDPRHHAARGIGHAADGRTAGAHVAHVRAHAAAALGDAGDVGVGVVDALQAVVDGVDEARGQLAADLAGVLQRRRGHGHVQVRQRPVGLADELHAALAAALGLVLHQVQRDGEPALLRQFEHGARGVGGQIPRGQQVQAVVGEQLVPLGVDHAAGFLQLFLGVGAQDVVGIDVAVGQRFLQAHVGAVFLLGVVEAVAAGALVQAVQVQARGEEFPLRRGDIDAGLGLADQVVGEVVGVDGLLALDEAEHAALVVGDVELRELGMGAVDAALQARAVVGNPAIAGFLGDPGGDAGIGVGCFGNRGVHGGTRGRRHAQPGRWRARCRTWL